jgi:hypothetical protein
MQRPKKELISWITYIFSKWAIPNDLLYIECVTAASTEGATALPDPPVEI